MCDREYFFSILWRDDFNELLASRAVWFFINGLVILTFYIKIKVILDSYFSTKASKIAIHSFLEDVHVLIVLQAWFSSLVHYLYIAFIIDAHRDFLSLVQRKAFCKTKLCWRSFMHGISGCLSMTFFLVCGIGRREKVSVIDFRQIRSDSLNFLLSLFWVHLNIRGARLHVNSCSHRLIYLLLRLQTLWGFIDIHDRITVGWLELQVFLFVCRFDSYGTTTTLNLRSEGKSSCPCICITHRSHRTYTSPFRRKDAQISL